MFERCNGERLYVYGVWRGQAPRRDRASRLRAAQPDASYRHSTLSFAVRAPVIGVPQARYAVPFVGYRTAEAGVPGQGLQTALQVLQVESDGGLRNGRSLRHFEQTPLLMFHWPEVVQRYTLAKVYT